MGQKYCGKCGKPLEDEWISCPFCNRVKNPQASISQQSQGAINTNIKNILKNYLWLFPLVAGILTFVALLTPVVYLEANFFGIPVKSYLWMWGFAYGRKGFVFIDDNFAGFSFLCSWIFLFSAILLIVVAYKIKNSEKDIKYIEYAMYGLGCFEIIILTLWIIILEIFYSGIWTIVTIGFGIIGIIISATIVILGGFLKANIH